MKVQIHSEKGIREVETNEITKEELKRLCLDTIREPIQEQVDKIREEIEKLKSH